MEAMIRGLQKFVEDEVEEEGKETASTDECHHNEAAWHNVPHPEERLKFWSDPDPEYLSDGNRLESNHATGAS
ncbi:hypothetical protein V6N13_111037 [Hibiscus sabdariffa]|uniref:Uncharacterized protein n=1 Tax=Hibiscus sabdariffa TaxID=183260 RepID=A0ABR2TJB2_9ROSI